MAKKKIKQEQLFFKQNDNDDNIFYDKMKSLYNLISQKLLCFASYKSEAFYMKKILGSHTLYQGDTTGMDN